MAKNTKPTTLFNRAVGSIHCVGIGGMGLGPLAIYLSQLGYRISGEDDGMSEAMRSQLIAAGIEITATGKLPAACDLVAISSAIATEHPAHVAARDRQIPIVRRGELLAEVVRDRRLVAICGSHGKTTTTAMLITILRQAGFPAGWILGGLFNDDTRSPAQAGSNDWVVAEIDESDGTIERFSPALTLAVNLDWDHPDYYRQAADLEATFAALFSRTHGPVLVSDACAWSGRTAARSAADRMKTFGRTGDFTAQLEGESGACQQLSLLGQFSPTRVAVQALGEFNAMNATAAFAAAQLMGVSPQADALAGYPGVRRRQSVLLSTDSLMVLEDYAHHPAEIRALLASLRKRVGTGRLQVVFQPHRFSRTAQFKSEFAAALALADRVHLLDVYAAGEAHVPGGTTADLYAELQRNAPNLSVSYCPGESAVLLQRLLSAIQPRDWVAFVGAGDIEVRAREWLGLIEKREARAKRWDELAEAWGKLVSPETKLRREEILAGKTTMRVGGAARIYAEPADVADLAALVKAARSANVPLLMLGRGSNLLVPDDGVDGLVVSLAQAGWQNFEPMPDGRVKVGAGLRLKNLCGLATKAGLVGFEFLEGIPGNIGGALRMNAGAMGGWIFDVVEEVELMTLEGDVRVMKKAEMHVDYRHCEELHHAIALGAVVRPAAQAEAAAISSKIEAYREKRQKSQPREPSAGCVFKNPPGDSAGRLIDVSGLKGTRVGDAEVSAVHGNFIINRGNATSADVIELVRRVRARVEQASGVRLEPEVLLYGKEWRDCL